MHVQREFLISLAASDAEVRWAAEHARPPRQGLKPLRHAARAAKETPHEIIEDRRPGCRRFAPKLPAPTHP